MHPRDRYHPPDEFGTNRHIDLPELPIPRPSGGLDVGTPIAAHEPAATPLRTGASFTAADEGTHTAPHADTNSAREQIETERFTWELAARLTAGMLANPARTQASVKDAMAMFDQFLHEMHTYTRITADFSELEDDGRRRREHVEYFHGAGAPDAVPGYLQSKEDDRAPRSEPVKPRPMGGHTPIPKGPYRPGGMSGEEPAA